MAKTEPKEIIYSFEFLIIPMGTVKKEYVKIEGSGFSEKEALSEAVITAKETYLNSHVEYTGNFSLKNEVKKDAD